MSTEIKAPQFPESVADGTVATWHKAVGEAVSRDELLVDIETDKVVLEVVAPADGVLTAIHKDVGETVLWKKSLGSSKPALPLALPPRRRQNPLRQRRRLRRPKRRRAPVGRPRPLRVRRRANSGLSSLRCAVRAATVESLRKMWRKLQQRRRQPLRRRPLPPLPRQRRRAKRFSASRAWARRKGSARSGACP